MANQGQAHDCSNTHYFVHAAAGGRNNYLMPYISFLPTRDVFAAGVALSYLTFLVVATSRVAEELGLLGELCSWDIISTSLTAGTINADELESAYQAYALLPAPPLVVTLDLDFTGFEKATLMKKAFE